MSAKKGRITPQVGFMIGFCQHLFKRKPLNRITAFPVRLTKKKTRECKAEVNSFRHPSERGKFFEFFGRALRPITGIRLRFERSATDEARACASHKRGMTSFSQKCDLC